MLKLTIPEDLQEEFATVQALWDSKAKTRRVDALILSWIKYEKQLRRLFCFFIFEHAKIKDDDVDTVITTLATNNQLYPETFIKGIEALGVRSVPKLLGDDYEELWGNIQRIKVYRNKLMHGQLTGMGIESPQLERDVRSVVRWIACLAIAAENEFGYNGVRRKTYLQAKATGTCVVREYPFDNTEELENWLGELSKTVNKAKSTSRKK